jgi:hypothetical protein
MTENHDYLLDKKNVNLIYLGTKTKKGQPTGERSIVVGVTKKIPLEELDENDVIPKVLNEWIKTDVVELGEIKPLNIENQEKHRPLIGGISIGPESGGGGTLGCIVNLEGEKYALTNMHVVDYALKGTLENVYQPAKLDGGSEIIGRTEKFSKINYPPKKPRGALKNIYKVIENLLYTVFALFTRKKISRAIENKTDIALIKLKNQETTNEILGLGNFKEISNPKIGMSVTTSGRSSGVQKAKIIGLEGRSIIQFPEGRLLFVDQIVIAGSVAKAGDSGSIVLDSSNKVVGAIFAGNPLYSLVNKAEEIQNEFGFKF